MKVIAFDLDDTLVPEALFIKSGTRHIARMLHKKYPVLSISRIISCMDAALFARCNHYSALEAYMESMSIDPYPIMAEIVAEFRGHIPDREIYHMPPSMVGILESLKKSSDIRLALVTDGRSITQRNKIDVAGLYCYFEKDDIFISGETGYDKNTPDSFLAIMRKYAGAEEYHYVGDNPDKDVKHPSRLGWYTHLVRPFPLAVHQGLK